MPLRRLNQSTAAEGEADLRSATRPYPGRLIFDHFPKTAGQAINAWLRDVLGTGTVTTNLIAKHSELLVMSGEYPITSAHIFFRDGEGLDPRFQYATLLREPVDRSISWLHFVIRNHRRSDHPDLYDASTAFLESCGEDFSPLLKPHLLNPAVTHFAAILGAKELEGEQLVDTAFRAMQLYDRVGIYERLDEFVASLAELIAIPVPQELRAVNVTTERPDSGAITPELKESISKLTALDRQLYARVVSLIDERSRTERPHPPLESKWDRYDRKEAGPQPSP